MKSELLDLLRCPETGARLRLEDADTRDDEIASGVLRTSEDGPTYRIVDHVSRFVPQANYAETFGLQWSRFRRTQLDSHSGVPVSRDRFYRYSGWDPAELEGRLVLDVGCGAGRFTEIALEAGAYVVAVDYSSAVDACWANHAHHPRLNVVQADVYRLPFDPGRFDFIYCFGVLQHTPDVAGAFAALPPQLRPGGRLAVDLYPWQVRNLLWSKYWLRPVTRRISAPRLFRAVERAVPILLPLSRAVGRLPGPLSKLRYMLPVVSYEGVYPLSESQLREWAALDTFDMLSPTHDHPQTAATLRGWMEGAKLEEVWVGREGFLVGRGRRPADPYSADE